MPAIIAALGLLRCAQRTGRQPGIAGSLMMDMARALNEGRIRSLQGCGDANSMPTGFAQFLREQLAG